MNKPVKLLLSAFVGFDIFLVSWLGLVQLRFMLFGAGAIPGGGSAVDMAIFLLPIFLGYLTADRLYHFFNYKQRRDKAHNQSPAAENFQNKPSALKQTASVWSDKDWEDQSENSTQVARTDTPE